MQNILFHTEPFVDESFHYIFYNDPDFLQAVRDQGYNWIQSRSGYSGKIDYAVFLEAEAIGIKRQESIPKRIYKGWSRSREKTEIYIKYRNALGVNRLTLIIAEGVLHKPENHSGRLHEMVKNVLTWNDDLVDGIHYHKYHWPVPIRWKSNGTDISNQRKLLVNISANKYSNKKGELYSARRKAIRNFERRLSTKFDHYGVGWNMPSTRVQKIIQLLTPIYPSFRGEVKSKEDVLKNYNFALCYENASVPGWITEKIFDCLRAGCIPIYLGAPNIAKYLPKEVFIDRRDFQSDDEVVDHITTMTQEKISQTVKSIEDYLKSEQHKKFFVTSLAERIISTIKNESYG